MLRIISKSTRRAVQISAHKQIFAPISIRSFSSSKKDEETLEIPLDKDHQYGRRKSEIDDLEQGVVRFSTDPIIPPSDAGTLQNPILVPSSMHERVVGYEDPYTHQLQWFNITPGPLHYIPDIGLFFKMKSYEA